MRRIVQNIKKLFESKPTASAEKWQLQIADSVKDYTMTSRENILTLTQVIKKLKEENIEGDIVECGVWKGGSMMAAAMTLHYLKDYTRQIYLYDTFDSFSIPENMDISYEGKTGSEILRQQSNNGSTWKAPSEEFVRQNMRETGYPFERLSFVKGQVERTIPEIIPNKIALLRLDTDWYSSTKHELEWLYPKLEKGGALIIDDYGYWQGCKKAVDEYFGSHNISSGVIKIDYSARLLYKK